MYKYANPTIFRKLTGKLLPFLWIVTIVALLWGFYQAFFVSPPDFRQGEAVRILYIHVPAAWLSLYVYGVMVICSIISIVFRHPLADVAAKAAAPFGAIFTLITLVTGSFWGKPMWGTWWEWDARLTSELILLIIYLGIIAFWQALEFHSNGSRLVAIFTILGSVNVIIVKYSVDWWNSLHQTASVLRMEGPAMDGAMLWPLLTCALGATTMFVIMHIYAIDTELMKRRIRSMLRRQAQMDMSESKAK